MNEHEIIKSALKTLKHGATVEKLMVILKRLPRDLPLIVTREKGVSYISIPGIDIAASLEKTTWDIKVVLQGEYSGKHSDEPIEKSFEERRIEEIKSELQPLDGEKELHPWYGPCDKFGPNNECSECARPRFDTAEEFTTWLHGKSIPETNQ